ncbi:MAG: zinc ribbon domain-containing protein [Burkholderiales bacterium]
MAVGCPNCGHVLSMSAKTCPNCGEPLEEMNDTRPCVSCWGTGTSKSTYLTCRDCSGTGRGRCRRGSG